jgi:hypothetical protein
VCKFLLEEKLDVDHVGVKRYDDDMMFRVLVERCEVLRCLTTDNNRSPINWEWNDDEMSATEWRAVRECRLLMLDAGADPLLDVDSESESLLRALTGGGLEDVSHGIETPLRVWLNQYVGLSCDESPSNLKWRRYTRCYLERPRSSLGRFHAS